MQSSALACAAKITLGSFPGEADGHKTKGTLSGQIIERITKELGIRVTPHQFRHLAAAFILEKDPANYEFVRRVLGHKNLETTINFYVGSRPWTPCANSRPWHLRATTGGPSDDRIPQKPAHSKGTSSP